MSALWMFPALIVVILTGFPVALTMMALAVVFGLHSFGVVGLQYQFIQKIEEVATAQVLAAVPLFIFMGAMFEASGIASRLFDAIHMWTRRIPGGLADYLEARDRCTLKRLITIELLAGEPREHAAQVLGLHQHVAEVLTRLE